MARRRAGLTQRQLSARSGVAQPTIARIERGVFSPTVANLDRLLHACDQELESVALPADRDLDWDQIDDHLEMSIPTRAEFAGKAGRAMLEFRNAARRPPFAGDRPFDPTAILRSLAGRAEFVVIGGFAASLRGSPVISDDVDICYAQESSNRWRLAAALVAIEARIRGERLVDFEIEEFLAVGDHCTFDTTVGTVDTVANPRATNGYSDLAGGAERLDIGDSIVLVPSLDDLVRMKVDGHRLEDWFALHYLRGVRKRVAVNRAMEELPSGGG
jgi:transcriptional regulator with XRE-family HTH domain